MNRSTALALCWIFSALVSVTLVAPRAVAQEGGSGSSTKCKLQDVGKPVRTQDNAARKVTFTGTVENQGDAVAHGVRVRFKIVGAKDDFVVDDQAVFTEPASLDPGAKATFAVSASWTGVGAHGGGKEVLSREMESCEAPGSKTAAEGGACDLHLSGNPSIKLEDETAGTVRVKGSIENGGPGTAKAIRVSAEPEAAAVAGASGEAAPVAPEVLDPGKKGTFDFVATLPKGASAGDLKVRLVSFDCEAPMPPPP